MKKTQKIKHKKHPNSVHLTKSASHKTPASDSPTKTVSLLHTVSYHNPVSVLSYFTTTPYFRQTHMINSACESYRSDVEQVAAKYDMSAYVDLILALMMQESSGQGTDVMQSSEGAYNTQYPQTPNGITDVDYSIACGIQEPEIFYGQSRCYRTE